MYIRIKFKFKFISYFNRNNIHFNENIMSMIISINPIYIFLSLLSIKYFYIADYLDKKNIRIYPMKKHYFNFLNKWRNNNYILEYQM